MVPLNSSTARSQGVGNNEWGGTMFRKHANFGDYRRSVLISVAAMLLGSLSFGSGRAVADGPPRSDRVDMAIIFAVDRSSLSHSETLQMVRDGHIAALRSLNSDMTSGPNQCVAVTYREWSGSNGQRSFCPGRKFAAKQMPMPPPEPLRFMIMVRLKILLRLKRVPSRFR